MSDRVKITTYVEPIEELTSDDADVSTIIASEVGKNLGGSASIDVTNFSNTASEQGYLNKTVNYLEAIDSADTTDISSLTAAKVVYIKNTGYTYSSATELGAALDKSLKVMVATTQIALLPPGASICLPNINGINCTTIHVRTVDNITGANNASAGHLSVEKFITD